MTRVYRLLRKPFSKQPFDGEGSFRFGGRWSSAGTRIAYTSEHLSLAILEYFVHIGADHPPHDLVVATAEIPDGVSTTRVQMEKLPATWRHTPPPAELAAMGDSFAGNKRAAVMIAPSVHAPNEANWLLNPQHPHFVRIKVRPSEPFSYDPRFFRYQV